MTGLFAPWFPALAARSLRVGLWRAIAWLALWLWGAGVLAQPAPLQLQAGRPATDLWQALQMLPDPEQRHTAQDLLQGKAAFGPMPPTLGTLGVRAEPVWLRLPLELAGTAPGRWVLDIDYAPLQRIDLVLASKGRIVQQAALGSHVPFAQRPLPTRSHAVELELQPGTPYELLLRVQTQGAMVLPLSLSPPVVHAEHALREQMLQGLLTGLALCLWIYSLAQWVNQREVLFLQYTLLISGSLLFSLHFFGVGAQYLWGGLPWVEQRASGLAALMATCGSFLFIGQALAAGNPRNRLMRAMRWGAAGTALLALAFALEVFDTRVLTAIVSVLGLVPALMGMPGALARMRQGDAVGGTLLLAWLVYFVATATVIGVIRGWVPVNFWTLHSFQFGATLDMLLFMRVLGLRSKALRLAAENARTERDTLHWLAHTDPLTNLPNRRGMQEALSNALRLCCHERLLAVYLLDLDGFKPVNDEHGHDAGDELLVAVARRLQGHVRATDLVARLGGDEFVVVASALESPAQAHELANKLLGAFHTPFALSSATVNVGLTIGYALAPLDGSDATSLLKLADAAMYQGKQNGKLRVQRSTERLAMP